MGGDAAQLKAAAAGTTQAGVLQSTGFLTRTPLWYYLLAEAKHHGGQRLGPVGRTIVAEVLIGLVRRSDDSILRTPRLDSNPSRRHPGPVQPWPTCSDSPRCLMNLTDVQDRSRRIFTQLLRDSGRAPGSVAAQPNLHPMRTI